MDDLLPNRLADRLAQGNLPGRQAQARFEPELSFGRHAGPAPDNARQGAVMILLYRHEDHWHLPLTLRPETMKEHPGQISLPGGAVDGDETTYEASLRELDEELGVGAAGIEPIGQLSPLYVFGSNFLVTPWLAKIDTRPDFVANPAEVAEILELPLTQLLDVRSYGSLDHQTSGITLKAPHIRLQNHRIWGATAMILGELTALLEEIGGQ
jgi:8-oxo-dGTP pyrophosphatase MutT (NUDIX family)